MTKRLDLVGKRLRVPGETAVYLIEEGGTRRWIPDEATYNNLFRTWDDILDDIHLDTIDEVVQISPGAALARAPAIRLR